MNSAETLTPPELSDEEKVRKIFDRLIAIVESEVDESRVTDPRHSKMVSDLLGILKEQQANLDQGLESVNPNAVIHTLKLLIRRNFEDIENTEDLANIERIFSQKNNR